MAKDIQTLILNLRSENPNTRYEACEELRVHPHPTEDALAELRNATQDSSEQVRDAAERGLAAHTPSASLPPPPASDSRDTSHNKGANFFWILATVVIMCCLAGYLASRSISRSSATGQPELRSTRGWLCDADGAGTIALRAQPSLAGTIVDAVGTCPGCCLDVTALEQTDEDGILIYKISVGSQSGWVDVDYFYWTKPDWAAN